MSKYSVQVQHTHNITEQEATLSYIYSLLRPLASEKLYTWDNKYWYTSLKDWGKIFEDVLLNMPKYTIDKFDCENFAMMISSRVSERYKLNTCGIAIGQSPFGEHGYNIFIAGEYLPEPEVYILDPQTGMVYPTTDSEGYLPRIIMIG